MYGNGNSNQLASGSSPTTRAVIQQGLDAQEQSLGNLHTVISDLESRLALVCETVPPEVGVASLNEKSSPQIIERVGRHGNGIDAAAGRLQRLMARLQL